MDTNTVKGQSWKSDHTALTCALPQCYQGMRRHFSRTDPCYHSWRDRRILGLSSTMATKVIMGCIAVFDSRSRSAQGPKRIL